MIETPHQANASQSYTLASRSKSRPTNQNLPKSMPAPTHARQKQCSKLKGKLTENNEHQPLTHGIVHAGFSGLQAFVARKKSRCKLIGFRFVIPHDTIPSNVVPNGRNSGQKRLSHWLTVKKHL